MSWDISIGHNNARLTGTRDYLDLGPGHATIELYGTEQPMPGGAAIGSPLATITLAKPCGVIVNNQLVLVQAEPSGDMIQATGTVLWGRKRNGAGDWAGDGKVTDQAGDGALKLAGTEGTKIYAGGLVLLGVTGLV